MGNDSRQEDGDGVPSPSGVAPATTPAATLAAHAGQTWRSFRRLPGRWQWAVTAMLTLLVLTMGDGQGASSRVPTSEVSRSGSGIAADRVRVIYLEQELEELRADLQLAREDAEAAEARSPATRTPRDSSNERLAGQLRGTQRRLSAAETRVRELRSELQASKQAATKARAGAKKAKRQLAAATAATAPVEAADAAGDASCHSSYVGECVPITSDVDCAGGSGDGPEYVGFVEVVGPDEYDLDRDGNGYACES